MVDAKAFIVLIPDTHKLGELCLDGFLYVILLVILAKIRCAVQQKKVIARATWMWTKAVTSCAPPHDRRRVYEVVRPVVPCICLRSAKLPILSSPSS